MRNGYKIYDSDTHVFPSAETLERYVEPSFRPRLEELAPFRLPVGKAVGIDEDHHLYRVHSIKYRRILGEGRSPPDLHRGAGRHQVDGVRNTEERECKTTTQKTVCWIWMTKGQTPIL